MDRVEAARAIARGAALGGFGVALAGWPGLLVGLVSTPLALVEAWGARRARPKTAALLAWAVALVWLAGVHLQLTFVGAFHGTGPERGDLGATLEAVRLEAMQLVSFSTATFDDLRGGVFVIGAMLLSLPVAYRLDPKRVVVGAGPILASAALIAATANPSVVLTFLGTFLWGWVTVVLLVLLDRVADGAAERVLGARPAVGEPAETA
jgi:hypothetical protein